MFNQKRFWMWFKGRTFREVSNYDPAQIDESRWCESGFHNIDSVLKAVAKYFGLRVLDLKASSRVGRIALARQIAMYLVRRETGLGFRVIGSNFGGRDHTTVLHACRKIELDMVSNVNTRLAVEAVQRLLKEMKS